MTQLRDTRNNQVYAIIRYENIWNPLKQQFVVNDNGQERIVPVANAVVL